MVETQQSAAAARSGGSYVGRHWRGELSLPKSWWLSGVLVFGLAINIVCIVAISIAIGLSQGTGQPALVLVALAVLVFQIAAYIWALVGVWRSASRYQGAKVWKYLAFIGSGFGVLISLGNVLKTLEAIGSM
ncbi:MAG: hypothetical protein FJX65_11830 [Alphaproteobacteria bacterium]|nr:hypothetical protein [Alphaproteobacteria bacterium]